MDRYINPLFGEGKGRGAVGNECRQGRAAVVMYVVLMIMKQQVGIGGLYICIYVMLCYVSFVWDAMITEGIYSPHGVTLFAPDVRD